MPESSPIFAEIAATLALSAGVGAIALRLSDKQEIDALLPLSEARWIASTISRPDSGLAPSVTS